MMDRRSLSLKARAELCLAQKGRCASCKEKLAPGHIEFDHIQALVHGGDNAPLNFRALCVGCHREKTREDNRAQKKVTRTALGGKSRNSKPMDGSRNSRFKKHMDGSVSYR